MNELKMNMRSILDNVNFVYNIEDIVTRMKNGLLEFNGYYTTYIALDDSFGDKIYVFSFSQFVDGKFTSLKIKKIRLVFSNNNLTNVKIYYRNHDYSWQTLEIPIYVDASIMFRNLNMDSFQDIFDFMLKISVISLITLVDHLFYSSRRDCSSITNMWHSLFENNEYELVKLNDICNKITD
jgi:hypothetical protein